MNDSILQHRLVVLTLHGSSSYYLYADMPDGRQYQLASLLAQSLGMELEIKLAHNEEELLAMLQNGEGDVVAWPVPENACNTRRVAFCGDRFMNHLCLVQRTGAQALADVSQLCGKTVYAKAGTAFHRLEQLNREMGNSMHIVERSGENVSDESLMLQVAYGDIDYCVADHDLALLSKSYFTKLDCDLALSMEQPRAWAVRQTSVVLKQFIDLWYAGLKAIPQHSPLAKRNYEMGRRAQTNPFLSIQEGIISRFDGLFRKYGTEYGYDWRLLAALAYVESQFDTLAISPIGAKGIMQVMPRTAKAMGVPDGRHFDTDCNIMAGTRLLHQLEHDLHFVTDPNERLKMALAAYNAGMAHLVDAIALTRKYGGSDQIWEGGVDFYLTKKNEEAFYADTICRYGKFNAEQTLCFVQEVLKRYESYKIIGGDGKGR